MLVGATMQCPSVICTVGDINGPTSIIPHYTDCLNFSTHTALHISIHDILSFLVIAEIVIFALS